MTESSPTRDPEAPEMPGDMELARTTPLFDPESVPKAILGSHQVAAGVWGRLVCRTGRVGFAFEEPEDSEVVELGPGEHFDIPPERRHRVVLLGPSTFVVEFYRPRSTG